MRSLKTKTVGEMLKEERERYRLSIEEVSKRTRIRVAYLQALEENDFQDLPAATFVKGYIKTYAKLFDLEYQPLIALLRRDFKESAKGELVPRDFLKPVIRDRFSSSPITLLALLVAVAFGSLLLYVGIQWYNLNQPPELAISAPEEESIVASQVVVRGQTHPEATVLVNLQPVALQPDGSFETEVFLPREGVSTITIESTDRQGRTSLEQRTVVVEF